MTLLQSTLQRLSLDDKDWELLEWLKVLLEVSLTRQICTDTDLVQAFNELTEFFSRSDFPGICYALRSLDALIVRLQAEVDGDGPQALRAAARLGCNKLRKYQKILLGKELYLFATGTPGLPTTSCNFVLILVLSLQPKSKDQVLRNTNVSVHAAMD